MTACVRRLRRLGSDAKTLHMTTLALIHLAAEYWDPVWCCSKHTHLVDKPIHGALRLVTGCLHTFLIDNLFVLAGITPAELFIYFYGAITKKKSHTVSSLSCNEPRAPSPRSTPVHNNYTTARTQIEHPFVKAALELLKDLYKSNTTAAFWADHKWNISSRLLMTEKCFSPPHIYSISWPLTTGNDPA